MDKRELWRVAVELLGEEELTRRFRGWITGVIRKAREKRAEVSSDALYDQDALTILSDLNERTGRKFGATDEAKRLIRGIMAKGYLVEDFIRVHEVKCDRWLGDEKMEHNLRPSTLYRPCHFDEYLAEWFGAERKKKELAEKRAAALKANTRCTEKAEMPFQHRDTETQRDGGAVKGAEREAVVSELMARAWWAFPTWADFVKWTSRFPDMEAIKAYAMPERIRRMREAPMMLWKVIRGESPDWAEREYKELKEKEMGNGNK